MKVLLKKPLIFAVLLSGGIYLYGCISSKSKTKPDLDKFASSKCQASPNESIVAFVTGAEKQNLAKDEIFIHLSPLARVYLKNNRSYTGQLMRINSQQIKVETSDRQVWEDVINIEKVVFSYKNLIVCGKKLVIRGEKKDNSENWTVSLDDLNLTNPSKGQAKLKLKDIDSRKLRAIKQVANKSSYIIKEIDFNSNSNSPGKIIVKVEPQ